MSEERHQRLHVTASTDGLPDRGGSPDLVQAQEEACGPAELAQPSLLASERRATLRRFATAWASEDLDTLLDCMTPDCEYRMSTGPEPGTTWRGAIAVSDGFEAMFASMPRVRAETSEPLLFENHAFWTWRYFETGQGGALLAAGCDLFTFRGALIAVKDAYRKVDAS